MNLHIGSGDHYAEGWLNVEIDQTWRADVYASVFALPFADNRFDRIYMGHFLEHIEPDQLPAAFAELRRVSTADCVTAIVGPCHDKAVAMYGRESNLVKQIAITNPIDTHPGGHKWTATTANTLDVIEACGMLAMEVDVASIRQPEWPNPAPDQAWQCAFLARWK